MKQRHIIAVWLVVVPLILLASWGGLWLGVDRANGATTGPSRPAHVERWMVTPCAYEDSVNCYWDARARGNGRGHSFYAIRVGRSGVLVRYWDRDYGRKHDRFYPDGR